MRVVPNKTTENALYDFAEHHDRFGCEYECSHVVAGRGGGTDCTASITNQQRRNRR